MHSTAAVQTNFAVAQTTLCDSADKALNLLSSTHCPGALLTSRPQFSVPTFPLTPPPPFPAPPARTSRLSRALLTLDGRRLLAVRAPHPPSARRGRAGGSSVCAPPGPTKANENQSNRKRLGATGRRNWRNRKNLAQPKEFGTTERRKWRQKRKYRPASKGQTPEASSSESR